MKKKLHLIYIPGLGDSRVRGQRAAVRTWRWWGVTAELCRMNWADDESWPDKFDRLLTRIDAASKNGKPVGLVAASAGATAALNAFAARQDVVIGVVLIAGKANRPAAIGQGYRRRNPAFLTSAQDAQLALQSLSPEARRRIQSRYARLDEMVSRADSHIPGADNKQLRSMGHFVTIALQIVFGVPDFIRFLRHQAAQMNDR